MKRYLWSATRLLAVLSVGLAILSGTGLHLVPVAAPAAFADDDNDKKANGATTESREAGRNNNIDRVGGPSGSEETIIQGKVVSVNTIAEAPYFMFSTLDCDVRGWIVGTPAKNETRELRIGRNLEIEGQKVNECEWIVNSYRGGDD